MATIAKLDWNDVWEEELEKQVQSPKDYTVYNKHMQFMHVKSYDIKETEESDFTVTLKGSVQCVITIRENNKSEDYYKKYTFEAVYTVDDQNHSADLISSSLLEE